MANGNEYEKGEKKKILLEEFYKPPQETMEFIYSVYDKFIKWRSLREQPYKQFNNTTLQTYLDDSRKKFWGYLPINYDTDTPQFFFPETRNQIIAILAKIAGMKMKPSFDGVEGFDIIKATVLKDLFEYWRRGSNKKIANFWQFLYNIINGTVVVFTAYNSKERTVKTITEYDPASGETQYKEEKLDDSEIEDLTVNLEDLYIPKIWEPDIQEQDELIHRVLMKWSDFKNAFKGYSQESFVIPGSQFSDSSIFADFLSYDIRGADFVEVIRYYNVPKDQFAIIANGVLLNPMKTKKGEEIAPLPWNHKKLPFSKTIYEPIDANFFYGMPLAQKVKSPQEALNRMFSLMLEREERSVAAPIITTDPSVEMGLEFKAGRIYQVQADPSQYKELTVSPTSNSTWNAINTLQGIITKTGSGGIGPTSMSRQPRSATENSQVSQEKKEASGLYFMFYQDLLEQKVWLTIMNMIQFYTSMKTEKILGARKFKKIISLTETRLFGGGMGNHEIRITDSPNPPEELKKESYLRSLLKKEKVEIIEVTPKSLREIRFDIKINFEIENSPETERALYLDYVMTLMRLFGQTNLLNPKKMLYRTVEKFGESIGDVVNDEVVADYESDRFGGGKMQAAQPGAQGTPNPNGMPGVGDVNQQMRGQMFGAQGPAKQMAEGNILQKF